MNRYINEVIDAHVAIETWLSRGEGEPESLLDRFSREYTMIALSGAKLDFATLSHFFTQQRASRPGLKIVVDQISILDEWDTGAVLLYREKQSRPDHEATTRWSTVVLRQQEGKLRWLHLHETLQPA